MPKCAIGGTACESPIVADSAFLPPLLAALASLRDWLGSTKVEGLVIGGVAASVLGRPRVTKDVDLLILLPENAWDAFLAAGKRHGFEPRVPDALALARELRMLLLRHTPSGVDIDISVGSLLFEEEALARGQHRKVGGVLLLLPTPEDLIIMKAVAHRDRDLSDIEGVLDTNPKLDKKRIRHWVGAFAESLEMPELLDDLERLLAPRRRK